MLNRLSFIATFKQKLALSDNVSMKSAVQKFTLTITNLLFQKNIKIELSKIMQSNKFKLYSEKSDANAVTSIDTKILYNIRKCIYRAPRCILAPLPTNIVGTHNVLNHISVETIKNEDFLLVNNEQKHNYMFFVCY